MNALVTLVAAGENGTFGDGFREVGRQWHIIRYLGFLYLLPKNVVNIATPLKELFLNGI